jgi:hypothetical protein
MKSVIPFILILVTFGCDTVHNDVDLKSQRAVKMVIATDKSTVMDLQKMFPGFTKVELTNSSAIKYFSDRYVKYSADASAPSKFSFNVTASDNTKTQVNVTTSGQSASCADSAPFTYATVSNKSSLVVNLLNNPEFCNYDIYGQGEIGIAGSRPGIDLDQNSDQVWINICSCGSEGNSAILTYVPPQDFVGQIKFKYYLHAGADYQLNGEAIYYDPQYSKYFSAHDVIIDVTN